MNEPITPEPSEESVPDRKAQESDSNLTPLAIAGSVIVVAVIVSVITVVMYEQRHKTEQAVTPIVSPGAISSPTPKPAPLEYAPAVPELNRDQAISVFLTVTGITDSTKEQLVRRWQQKNIIIGLRGQPRTEDEQCLAKVISELNAVMETSQLTRSENGVAPIQIYILPRNQFTSVEVDSPPDRDALTFYDSQPDFSLLQANILVNAETHAPGRCYYIRGSMLNALGLIDGTTDPSVQGFVTLEPQPVDAIYSPYDLEMVRILYSSRITSGLTAAEVERRLNQE